MARIPENEIERLKSEVAVERLVEAAGIELKRSGKDLLGCCPFHTDDTASLVVTPSKNLWHCFGCQVGGGPIDWVMKQNGVSFRHAIEMLREGVSSLAARGGAGEAGAVRAVKHTTVRGLTPPVAFDADDQQLMNDTVAFYHERLKQSPQALAYLEARGIASAEAIDTFKLGFADRTLGLRLPDKRRREGQAIRERLERIGLFRASGHEHFTGSLIIPVMDANGNVSEIYGRKIIDRLRAGTPLHLYLPAGSRNAGRGVWNLHALQGGQEIILTEALIDALTFWCAGYRNVTASYGVEGFTQDHLEAFKQFGAQRVLIAYDRDEAGDRAAQTLAEKLMGQGIECFRIQFPKGMDANEYAMKVQPASKSLGVVIRKALWLGVGKTPVLASAVSSLPTVPPFASSTTAAKEEADQPAPPTEEVPPASPVPTAASPEIACEVRENEVAFVFGDRRYRVRGLAKNLAYELLKVNVLVSKGEAFHVDTFDLYAAKARAGFVTQAATELGLKEDILKADLGRVLLKLEGLQETLIEQALKPKAPVHPAMSEAAHAAAVSLLKSPDLVEKILADFDTCALVGERTNKLVGYLAAISRKLDRPLGIVIQSSSAAGKTTLMDAVLAFVPVEDKTKYSAMTGQSLFYMGETNLKNKVLALVEEEGASRASYALKLLQSEGELTIASTGKDPTTGNLITQQYKVEGPVALLFTTTARDLDEELMNRCLVLCVDESRDQTRAIHQRQRGRRTLQGLMASQTKSDLIALHQNAQRLLKPLAILNPYAQHLTFPDQSTRLRRDHEKYLTLIDTIALLHQHQRPIKTLTHADKVVEYVEVTLADIALANEIAHEVLGRSLDELPPQTRRLLSLIDGYVSAECQRQVISKTAFHFSRRTLREAIAWGDTQLKIHLARLVELEYLVAQRTSTGGYAYELLYDLNAAQDTVRFPGLVDVEALRCIYDAARSGDNPSRSGSGRGAVGPQSGAGRRGSLREDAHATGLAEELTEQDAEMHVLPGHHQSASYLQPTALAAAARE